MNVIKSLPLTPEIERLLDIANKINSTWNKADHLVKFRKFSFFCMTHGYNSVVLGNVPAENIEEARELIAYAYALLESAGEEPRSMFAYEVVEMVYDIGFKALDAPSLRRDRAIAKLTKYQQTNNISALKNVIKVIDSTFIPYYDWIYSDVHDSVFKPTDSDKMLLWEAKQPTIDRILEVMLGHNWEWFKGYESEAQKCSQAEFLEACRLASWMDFSQNTFFINQQKLDSLGYAHCNESPQLSDDTRRIEISFQLYPSLPTESSFDNSLYFSAERRDRV